jgi:hypothetical protein
VNVFYNTRVDVFEPITLHLSIDASGSMAGEQWLNSLTAAVAIAKAATLTRNIRVVISVRSVHSGVNDRGTYHNGRRRRGRRGRYSAVTDTTKNTEYPLMAIVYDSKVDPFVKITSLFKYLAPKGNQTPEGLTFEAILDTMVEGVDGVSRSYFINFSDGAPNFNGYEGTTAAKHTNQMITRMRDRGIKILSYFISNSAYRGWSTDQNWEIFKRCYDKDAVRVNVTNIIDIARTLNAMFLQK